METGMEADNRERERERPWITNLLLTPQQESETAQLMRFKNVQHGCGGNGRIILDLVDTDDVFSPFNIFKHNYGSVCLSINYQQVKIK